MIDSYYCIFFYYCIVFILIIVSLLQVYYNNEYCGMHGFIRQFFKVQVLPIEVFQSKNLGILVLCSVINIID